MIRHQAFHGSSLVMSVVVSAMLLLLLGIILSFAGLLQLQVSRETRQAQALAIGEGGLNYALAQFRSNPSYRGEADRTVGNGVIDLQITSYDANWLITSRSYVPSKIHPFRVCRAFMVVVTPTQSIIDDTYHELSGNC